MKKTINFYDFEQAFQNANRFDQFGYDGLKALFDYLENYEDETGEEIELDVIGLCCDFTLYENLKEFQADYGEEYESIDDIEEMTWVIPVNGEAFIILNF